MWSRTTWLNVLQPTRTSRRAAPRELHSAAQQLPRVVRQARWVTPAASPTSTHGELGPAAPHGAPAQDPSKAHHDVDSPTRTRWPARRRPRCRRHMRWSLVSLRHTNECLGPISTSAHAALRAIRATMPPRAHARSRPSCVRSYRVQIEAWELSGARHADHRNREYAGVQCRGAAESRPRQVVR